MLTRETRRALAFGRLSAEDAAVFCALAEEAIGAMRPLAHYVEHPAPLPQGDAARWFILNCIRQHVRDGKLQGLTPRTVNRFLSQPARTSTSSRCSTDLVDRWGALGADAAMLALLKKVATRCDTRAGNAIDAAAGARIARGLRMVTVPFPHLVGARRGGARVARRPAADDGRVRVGAAGRESGVRRGGSRTASSCSCSRTRCCTSRCGRTIAPAARPAGVQLRARLHHQRHPARRARLQAIPAGGLDMPGARQRSAEEIVLEMRRNATAPIEDRVWEGDDGHGAARFGGAGPRRRRSRRRARRRARDVSCSRTTRRARRRSAERMTCARGEALCARAGDGCAAEAARQRRRRREPERRRAARHLPHTVGARAAALDGIGRAGRAHVRAPVAPRRGARPTSSCPAGGAKAGCSTWCSTRAAR